MGHMEAERPLQGKVAIITGAGRGIGQALAKAYAAAGAAVCCAARSEAEVHATARAIEAAGGSALAVTADVSDEASVGRMVEATVTTFGGLDLLVLNAGITGDGATVEDSDAASWRKTIEVNLIGPYLCARAAIPALKQRGGGKIITIGSGAGHAGSAGVSAYGCSKAGLWMLTRVLARELASSNIDVNEFIPGPVATDMTTSAAGIAHLEALPRDDEWWLKTPNDLLPLAMFLATQPARGPTGQSFGLLRRQV